MFSFEKVAILGQADTDERQNTLQKLESFLCKNDYIPFCEPELATLLTNCTALSGLSLADTADLLIVVGGDGSFLRAAPLAAKTQTPIIGINKGRLGFLTDIRPNEIETRLLEVLQGKYWTAERFLLEACMVNEKKTKSLGLALNEVVLSRGQTTHMLEFEIFVNDELLCSQRADGLLVSTPTGSTAYALSGGGPIVQPEVDALVMLVMFSHTLSNRPIVIPRNSRLRVEFPSVNKMPAYVNCSSNNMELLTPGATLLIEEYPQTLKLIHPMDYNYYETLRDKLHWAKTL